MAKHQEAARAWHRANKGLGARAMEAALRATLATKDKECIRLARLANGLDPGDDGTACWRVLDRHRSFGSA